MCSCMQAMHMCVGVCCIHIFDAMHMLGWGERERSDYFCFVNRTQQLEYPFIVEWPADITHIHYSTYHTITIYILIINSIKINLSPSKQILEDTKKHQHYPKLNGYWKIHFLLRISFVHAKLSTRCTRIYILKVYIAIYCIYIFL